MAFSDSIAHNTAIWDPTTASRDRHHHHRHHHSSSSDSEDYYRYTHHHLGPGLGLAHAQPLGHDFDPRAASQLEIWGVATGTCFLALLLCWLLLGALWSAIVTSGTALTSCPNTAGKSPSATGWRSETRTAHALAHGATELPLRQQHCGTEAKMETGEKAPSTLPPPPPRRRYLLPRLLADLRTAANASAAELAGAARWASAGLAGRGPLLERETGGIGRIVGLSSSSSSSPSSSSPSLLVVVTRQQRVIDVEEGLGLGPGSRGRGRRRGLSARLLGLGPGPGPEGVSSSGPGAEDDDDEEQEIGAQAKATAARTGDAVSASVEVRDDGNGGPFLRRKSNGALPP